MKPSLSIAIAVLALLAFGCSTTKPTILQIGGTGGTSVTVRYKAGSLSGTVSTVTGTGSPSKVLEVSVSEKDFECDISKSDRAAHISAELVQEGKSVFRADAAPGTQGVRISRTESGWKQETY